MQKSVYAPKNNDLSYLYIGKDGNLHSDTWYIIDGVGSIERDNLVFRVYFLTYCL